MRFSSRNTAYTLVELLVAVVIVGILSSIAIAYVSEIWKGQIIISNLENMRSWIESVRRAAVRGEACEITITNTNLKDGSVVLESKTFNTTSTIQPTPSIESTPCFTPIMSQKFSNPRVMVLESSYRKEHYILTAKSGLSNVSSFVLTPRGTLFNPDGTNSFGQDILINLAISDSNYKKISQSYCLRMSSFLGTIKSIGTQAC